MSTITADELAKRLGEPGLLLVDARDEAAFRAGSLPGAVHLNVYDYFIPASTPEGAAEISAAGVADISAAACGALSAIGAREAHEVVYFENATGMISPRGLWFHEFAGLSGGRILDGGLAAWRGALVPGEGPARAIRSGSPMPAGWVPRRELLATVEDITGRDPARTQVLDVRRRTEFEGSFVHPCCARRGRIPGALFLFWEDFLADGHYAEAAIIAHRAAGAGLDPAREIILYCHRGARAATALYGLRRAGYAHTRVFVGSWHEWAERRDLPLLCEA